MYGQQAIPESMCSPPTSFLFTLRLDSMIRTGYPRRRGATLRVWLWNARHWIMRPGCSGRWCGPSMPSGCGAVGFRAIKTYPQWCMILRVYPYH